MDGCGGTATSESLAVLPFTVFPLMTVETLPLVLLYVPTAGTTTSTETTHVPPGAMVPPVKVSELLPGAGAKVGEPQPVAEADGDGATCICAGEDGSESVGTLVVVVPLCVVERNPPTFECGPGVVAVTLTLTVHEPLAGMVPPLKVSDVAPAVGAQVPPQVVAADGVAATCTPAGRPSVNAAPVSAPVLVLVSVKVSVETPLTAIGSGEKDLVRVGLTGSTQAVSST